MFEGVIGNGYMGDTALDDIKILRGQCPPPGYCDFEVDTCGYSNTRAGDDFDWQRSAGATLTANTGPTVDHTTGSDRGMCLLTMCIPTQPSVVFHSFQETRH